MVEIKKGRKKIHKNEFEHHSNFAIITLNKFDKEISSDMSAYSPIS